MCVQCSPARVGVNTSDAGGSGWTLVARLLEVPRAGCLKQTLDACAAVVSWHLCRLMLCSCVVRLKQQIDGDLSDKYARRQLVRCLPFKLLLCAPGVHVRVRGV